MCAEIRKLLAHLAHLAIWAPGSNAAGPAPHSCAMDAEVDPPTCCICLALGLDPELAEMFHDDQDDPTLALECGCVFHEFCLTQLALASDALAMRCPKCRSEQPNDFVATLAAWANEPEHVQGNEDGLRRCHDGGARRRPWPGNSLPLPDECRPGQAEAVMEVDNEDGLAAQIVPHVPAEVANVPAEVPKVPAEVPKIQSLLVPKPILKRHGAPKRKTAVPKQAKRKSGGGNTLRFEVSPPPKAAKANDTLRFPVPPPPKAAKVAAAAAAPTDAEVQSRPKAIDPTATVEPQSFAKVDKLIEKGTKRMVSSYNLRGTI